MVMINLNQGLYKEVSEIVKRKPIDYPSIKNFCEKSIVAELKSIKVNEEYQAQQEFRHKEILEILAKKKLKGVVAEKIYNCIALPSIMSLDYTDVKYILNNVKKFESIVLKANNVKGMCNKLRSVNLEKAIVVFELPASTTLDNINEFARALAVENLVIGARVQENMRTINAYLAIAI